MSESNTDQQAAAQILDPSEERCLLDLLAYLEARIPAAYRAELLSYLLPRALPEPLAGSRLPRRVGPREPHPHAGARVEGRPEAEPQSSPSPGSSPHFLLLSRRGESLLKALLALHYAETRLGIRWMTPTEIARLISAVEASSPVYRSNLSNALRKEKALVSRRPRGRGFEYGLAPGGRARVNRELRLLAVEAEGTTDRS